MITIWNGSLRMTRDDHNISGGGDSGVYCNRSNILLSCIRSTYEAHCQLCITYILYLSTNNYPTATAVTFSFVVVLSLYIALTLYIYIYIYI
jgi:hypothetical protein